MVSTPDEETARLLGMRRMAMIDRGRRNPFEPVLDMIGALTRIHSWIDAGASAEEEEAASR